MSFPSKKISSLFFDITHTTPLYMRTLRIKRSPKKFLISTSCPASEMAVLIGKWAYTNLILYLNPFKTPLTMLLMWLAIVRTLAISFLRPKVLLMMILVGETFWIVQRECVKLRWRVPLGPVTVTTLAFTVTFTLKMSAELVVCLFAL